MRRHAGITVASLVLVASILFGACTRTWVLAGDPDAGGPPLDAVSSDTGGAGGKGGTPAATGGQGQGGAPGAAAGGAAGIAGAGGAGGRPAPTCPSNQDKIMVEILTTDLIFVVGRTMSMGTRLGETPRIAVVQSALRNLIQTYQSAVKFGYAEYPGLGPSCSNACCVSSGGLATKTNNWQVIDGVMHQCDFGQSCLAQNDARPIAPTLQMVPKLWGTQPHDPIVIMIADGPPGCPLEDPSQACQPALDAASMLSGQASRATFYVVALGQQAQNDMCLQQMAVRGGTRLIPVSENSPDPTGSLTESLRSIVAEAADSACTLQLTSKPARLDQVALFIRGSEVPFDPTGKAGWKFEDRSSVRIQVGGTSCQKVQGAKPADIWAFFGCAPCGEASPCP